MDGTMKRRNEERPEGRREMKEKKTNVYIVSRCIVSAVVSAALSVSCLTVLVELFVLAASRILFFLSPSPSFGPLSVCSIGSAGFVSTAHFSSKRLFGPSKSFSGNRHRNGFYCRPFFVRHSGSHALESKKGWAAAGLARRGEKRRRRKTRPELVIL